MRRVPPSLQRAEEAQVDGGAAQEPGLLGRLFSMSQVSIFSFLVLDGQGQQEGARQDCISSRVNNFYSSDLHVFLLCCLQTVHTEYTEYTTSQEASCFLVRIYSRTVHSHTQDRIIRNKSVFLILPSSCHVSDRGIHSGQPWRSSRRWTGQSAPYPPTTAEAVLRGGKGGGGGA